MKRRREQYGVFRKLLVQERQSRYLTQIQVAEKLGVPQSFISKVESGDRRIDVVEFIEIAEALGADPVKMLRKVISAKEN